MRRVWEILKDILIVLLVIAIVVLAILALPEKTVTSTPWLAGVLKPFARVLGMSEADLSDPPPQSAAALIGAAKPVAISIRNLAGRQSVQYDFAALDAQFEQLGTLLGQALDSASAPRAVTQEEVCTALQQVSAAFRYPAALSPQTAAAWLSVNGPEAPAAEWFILSAENDSVALYLAGQDCLAFDTGIPAEALASLLEAAAPDGSLFAFEGGAAFAEAAPLSLLAGTTPTLFAAEQTNPCEARFMTSMAASLGFNPYGDAVYTDAAGSTWYTESNATLQISAQGQVRLRVSTPDARFQAQSSREDARIEAARSLLSGLAADTLGDARLYLSEYTQDGQQAVCRFRYYLSGVPVLSNSGAAAEVRFDGASMTEATITLRTYHLLESAGTLLPAAQAAAILPAGAEMEIIYAEQEGVLYANWKS